MKKLIVIIPVILLISLSVYIGITYFNIRKYDEYYINNREGILIICFWKHNCGKKENRKSMIEKLGNINILLKCILMAIHLY